MLETKQLHVEAGTPVIALDGKKVGKVKEVRDSYVKVNAPWRRDYWLSFEQVLSADAQQALLVIPSDEINLYKMSRPGHEAFGRTDAPTDYPSRSGFERDMFGR